HLAAPALDPAATALASYQERSSRSSRPSRHRFHKGEQPSQQSSRRWWAAAYMEIHGQHRRHAAGTGVAAGEYAAIAGAIPDRHHPSRLRRRLIGALERFAHVEGDRAGYEQHVGMPRRRHEAKAEPLKVVEHVVEGMDFELAAVAGARIHLANRKRPPPTLAGCLAHA